MMKTNEFCTLSRIRADLQAGIDDPDPGPEALGRANLEAHALAHAAYRVDDASARAHAERLLYLINEISSFAPPMAAIPGLVWGVLSRAKLASIRARHGRVGPISAAEMERRLEDAVTKLGAHNHAFIDDMTARPQSHELIVFCKNWFGSTSGFTDQLTAIAQRSVGSAKGVVLHNLTDELSGTPHDLMRARFLERVGLRYDRTSALDDPDQCVESFSLLNYRSAVVNLGTPLMGLGSFYSIEGNWPLECARLVKRLSGIGFDEAALEIFSLHAGLDAEHAKEWLEIILSLPLSPEDCGLVVDGAVYQLQVRREMYDAMRRLQQ